MKILLISPGTPDEIDHRIIRSIPYLFSKAFIAPHAVATVAALTPEGHEIVIHDEYMRGPIEKVLDGQSYDIIGVSVISNQIRRSVEISAICKAMCPSAIIVAGGIGVETMIQGQPHQFDVVFHGEAEDTWPQFLKDVADKTYKKTYKTYSKPDLSLTPPPRWDLIKEDLLFYKSVSVQTTRGCPYDCSFCDVIYVYGRKPRNKSIDQVLEEIRRLDELGVQMVFIADDNFSGDRNYVKELLRRLIPLNNSFNLPLGFFTQLDITIAQDDELLQLLADANFYTLMIGVESINDDALQDLNKKQNRGISIPDAIRKIQSYGMVVLTHMIIGADSDDSSVFEKTEKFINDTNVVFHICHPLAAPPGTRLWYDLMRSGRIIAMDKDVMLDQFDILSNIIPKQMSRIELFEGLADYWEQVYSPEAFLKRAIGFLDNITNRPNIPASPLKSAWAMRKMMGRVIRYFMFEVEKVHRKTFFKLMRYATKDSFFLMPKVIYLYSFYLIDYRRSLYDAEMARKHAAWEREHPEKIHIDDGNIPVNEKFRAHARSIVTAVYHNLRKRTADKETMIHLVVRVLMDFYDRNSHAFEEFDDFYLDQINLCCDRILDQEAEGITTEGNLGSEPPAGFTREMVDALDSKMRHREMASVLIGNE